jgi:hypothetical protein
MIAIGDDEKTRVAQYAEPVVALVRGFLKQP